MKLLRAAMIACLLTVGCQVNADQILTISRDGVFERAVDISDWEKGFSFLDLYDDSGVRIAYPWMGESEIDYVIEKGRLKVNGKVVGIYLEDIQGKVNPDGIITICVPNHMLDEVKTYPGLQAITISGYWEEDYEPADLTLLQKFENLRYLHFSAGGFLDLSHVKQIANCSRLVSLDFEALILPEGTMEEVRKLENLRDLKVAAVSDEELSSLAGHPNLRSISRMWTGPGPDCVDFLKTLPQLQELTVIQSEIADEVFAWLARSNKLTSLSLPYCGVYDEKIEYIGQMTNLRYLELSYTEVGDDDLASLAGLENLRALYVGGYALTGQGLKYLAGMKNLTTLGVVVESTSVAIDKLARLENVRYLVLTCQGLSDQDVKKLKKFDHLKALDLSGTEVSDEVLKDLSKALSDCQVVKRY